MVLGFLGLFVDLFICCFALIVCFTYWTIVGVDQLAYELEYDDWPCLPIVLYSKQRILKRGGGHGS